MPVWIQTHEMLFFGIAGISLVVFAGALAAVPWVVVRIPEDYFSGRRRPRMSTMHRDRPVAWLLLQIGKNLAGVVFVLSGIIMLALPGQGILTILLGIALMNFPGKFRFERWLVTRGSTLRFINHLRRARGRPELILGDDPRPGETDSA
ncbi:MAG: hypothetical protein JXB42_11830 [Deltaproteobacteria bacterium]|nr:hypothetical protein [Deltaproteobacteria bacterium]